MNGQIFAKKYSIVLLGLAFVAVCGYFIFLQFTAPTLYEPDGYYHVASAKFIKTFGLKYKFIWAQFSTFKDFFSDKDWLFHILIIPFLFISDNLVFAGKCAVIFFNIAFLLTYLFVLKKYLSDFQASLFLFLPLFSVSFTLYFLYLRPATLVNIITLLAVYFLINKRWLAVSVLAALYSLTHISFGLIVVFALVCESLRYLTSRDFYLRNISAATAGCAVGFFIHPHFPNNLVSFYLNAVLVPWYTLTNQGDVFGTEFTALPTNEALIYNFILFFILGLSMWVMLAKRPKAGFSTFVWWWSALIYVGLAFMGARYWYTANILVFVFLASLVKDWMTEQESTAKTRNFVAACVVMALAAFVFQGQSLKKEMDYWIKMSSHYEQVGRWLEKNIPPGETIYHAYWSDSPYFICLNPKDNYLVVLDPIYMVDYDPKIFIQYRKLELGAFKNPREILKSVFKVRYGYTRKNNLFYAQVKRDPRDFNIIYEDELGIVFVLKD